MKRTNGSVSRYQTTWHDQLRHFSNLAFIGSYLFFEHGMVVPAACCTLMGETLLAPSAIKQKSWSTITVGSVFLMLALGTLTKATLFQ